MDRRWVGLAAAAFLTSSLGWVAGSNLYQFLEPKIRQPTAKMTINFTEGGGQASLTHGRQRDESSVIEQIIIAESNGDPNAKNRRSSATGAGQFLDQTWLEMIRTHRRDLAALSDKEKLELRRDPELVRWSVESQSRPSMERQLSTVRLPTRQIYVS
jgi:hypothetical protein